MPSIEQDLRRLLAIAKVGDDDATETMPLRRAHIDTPQTTTQQDQPQTQTQTKLSTQTKQPTNQVQFALHEFIAVVTAATLFAALLIAALIFLIPTAQVWAYKPNSNSNMGSLFPVLSVHEPANLDEQPRTLRSVQRSIDLDRGTLKKHGRKNKNIK